MSLLSNTPAELRGEWCTPVALFETLNREFNFALDAAASPVNALCSRYLTREENALARDWVSDGAVWVNPPYKRLLLWVEKAAEQSKKQNQAVVMLVPDDVSTQWFSLAVKTVSEVRFITGGRLAFRHAEACHSANPKGSVLLIWRPSVSGRIKWRTVERSVLMGKAVRRASGARERAESDN